MSAYYLVAIDISKDSLHLQTVDEAFLLPNTPAGLRQLLQRLRPYASPLIVCEATGGYERLLLETLRDANVACRLVNPARLRHFAGSEGIKAKTDAIDAKVILRFAQEKKLAPAPPLSAGQRVLIDLLDRRHHLCSELAREKNRQQKASKTTAPFIRKTIRFLERQIAAVEQAVREHIAVHPTWPAGLRELLTVSGVGEVTAWSILAYLPEITTLERNRLVALAGLAPFNRDSGTSSGPRAIFGGRHKVRRCLYMAAHSAASHNPVIKPYVQRLLARGKSYKSALVAAMRKLLLHCQSLLKNLFKIPLAP